MEERRFQNMEKYMHGGNGMKLFDKVMDNMFEINDDVSLDDTIKILNDCIADSVRKYVDEKTSKDPDYDFHNDTALVTLINSMGKLISNIDGNWTIEFKTKFDKSKVTMSKF